MKIIYKENPLWASTDPVGTYCCDKMRDLWPYRFTIYNGKFFVSDLLVNFCPSCGEEVELELIDKNQWY